MTSVRHTALWLAHVLSTSTVPKKTCLRKRQQAGLTHGDQGHEGCTLTRKHSFRKDVARCWCSARNGLASSASCLQGRTSRSGSPEFIQLAGRTIQRTGVLPSANLLQPQQKVLAINPSGSTPWPATPPQLHGACLQHVRVH